MKKIIALLAVVSVLLAVFCSCKGNENDKPTENSTKKDVSGYYVDDSSIKLDIGDEIE